MRYGILGFGHHGRKRLVPGFTAAKASKLAGIWRRDFEKAKADAIEFDIEHVFASAEKLCASSAIDAVFITSPDAFHMRDTVLALSHGKPVLCEKPLAMNVEQVKQMLVASHKANVFFGVAQNFRFNRSVNLIRDWLAAGRIGRPVFATAHFYFQSERSPRAWIYDPALARGGVIGDVGIHCLDVLRFILRDDIAAISTIAQSDVQSGAVEVSAALAIDFKKGTVGSVMVSFRSEYRTMIEIVGETGIIQSENGLSVDGPVDIILRKNGEIVEVQQVSNTDAYGRMLDSFSAAVQGSGNFASTGEDGLKNQLALDAAYASWHSGRKEMIPTM